MVAKQQRESLALSMQLPPGFYAGSYTAHPVLAVIPQKPGHEHRHEKIAHQQPALPVARRPSREEYENFQGSTNYDLTDLVPCG